ncbi:hypothetical protein [Gallaecimonas sp. GXIMD4217]|uniref:hypothetical protein n=1 Tax=Gallaecimonas sp. GXIMD4217 TaxID=3131927 RepID=UPI00311B2E3D
MNWQSFLKILHLLGWLLVGVGIYLYVQGADQDLNSLLVLAACWGLGGVMVSPWPVVKAIEWMQRQQ